MDMEERSRLRAKRMVTNRARSYDDAEMWDLDFWLSQTPRERLSALVAIRRDVEMVRTAREKAGPAEEGDARILREVVKKLK